MLKVYRLNHIFTALAKYRMRRVVYIALFWTLINASVTVLNKSKPTQDSLLDVLLTSGLVFVMSLIMGYLFVFTLKDIFKKKSVYVNFISKSLIVLAAALFMNFIVQFVALRLIQGDSIDVALENFGSRTFSIYWILKKTLFWVILFIITQFYLEINDKYSPGVFIDVLRGKYLIPKVEDRIVMFIDLKDSTPTAEFLGHSKYFLFIRDFIYNISMAIIEFKGVIYQYVGDEVVVSWKDNPANIKACLDAVIQARKNIQKNSQEFNRKYDVIPEFRVGIHVGEVTVGEIGIIKKDLAMTGDTMNTTARIRSACNEHNEKFIISKAFKDKSDLKHFQVKSLGLVDLRGKAKEIELFSLKI